MNRLFLLICVIAFNVNSLFAEKGALTNYLSGAQISIANLPPLKATPCLDDILYYNWMTPPQHGEFNKIINKVVFTIDKGSLLDYYGTSFEAEIDVNIELANTANFTTPLKTFNNIILKIKYDPTPGSENELSAIFQTSGYHSQKVIVNSVKFNNSLSPIPSYFSLESTLEWDRKFLDDCTSDQIDIFNTNINVKDELEINGTSSPFPYNTDEIDLEWAFVDYKENTILSEKLNIAYGGINQYNAFPSTLITAPGITNSTLDNQIELELNKLQYTRVTLKPPFFNYSIPRLSKDGYIVYRLNPVRYTKSGSRIHNRFQWQYRHYEDASTAITDYKLFSLTSTPTSGPTPKLSFFNVIKTFQHNKNLNWTSQTSFAEEGARKQVVAYFDGSQRNRQNVTFLSTEGISLSDESIYDFYGRPTLKIMPAPLESPKIEFKTDLNKTNSNLYNKTHFYNPSSTQCAFSLPAPMDNTYGASKYYSNNNPDKDRFNAYIPDAEGYPFSTTEFLPDNTNRISRQGGVGKNHQIGSGHETFSFYGKPLEEEVKRVFGSNYGKISHYSKDVTIDPNGEISIAYKNMSGKTIATSLDNSESNNLPIDMNPPPSTVPMTSIIIGGDNKQSIIRDPYNGIITSSYPLVVSKNGSYTFSFRMSPPFDNHSCDQAANYCPQCYYDVELSIASCDPSLSQSYTTSNVPINSNFNYSTCKQTKDLELKPPSFTVPLTKGMYYVHLKAKASDAAKKFFVDKYINDNKAKCLVKYEEIEERFLNDIDVSECNFSCEQCKVKYNMPNSEAAYLAEFTAKYTKYSLTPTSQDIDRAKADFQKGKEKCLETCQGNKSCFAKFQQMKADIGLGGQYGFVMETVTGKNTKVAMPKNQKSIYATKDIPTEMLTLSIAGNPVFKLVPRNVRCIECELPAAPSSIVCTTSQCITPNMKLKDFYKGELSNLDFKNLDGSETKVINSAGDPVSPIELTFEEFLNNWRQSWADVMVRFHPEYCYYQYCSNPTNQSSADFDNRIQLANSFDEANAIVNELRNAKGQPNITFSVASIADDISKIDPFFDNLTPSRNQVSFSNILANITVSNFLPPPTWLPPFNLCIQSMPLQDWSALAAADLSNPTPFTPTPPINCIDPIYYTGKFMNSTLCKGELNVQWRYFITQYMYYKTIQMNTDRENFVVGECSAVPNLVPIPPPHRTHSNRCIGTNRPENNVDKLLNTAVSPNTALTNCGLANSKFSSFMLFLPNFYEDDIRRFATGAELAQDMMNLLANNPITGAPNTAPINNKAVSFCEKSCEDMADQWIEILQYCNNKSNFTQLKTVLVDFCKSTCSEKDLNGTFVNPYGATTKPTGSVFTFMYGGSNYNVTSFEEIINLFAGFSPPFSINKDCNADLIAFPPAHDAMPVYSNPIVTNKPSSACICEKVNKLIDRYNNKLSITYKTNYPTILSYVKAIIDKEYNLSDADLMDLQTVCTQFSICRFTQKAIEIPKLLQCNDCMTCDEFNIAVNAFDVKYNSSGNPADLDMSKASNQFFFASFMNRYMAVTNSRKLIFNLGFLDYYKFAEQCQNHTFFNKFYNDANITNSNGGQ